MCALLTGVQTCALPIYVRAVGDEVTDFAVGETVGVGCMVDSCQACPSCEEGLEQYCTGSGFVGTYNAPTPDAPGHTLGGYSQAIVVSDKFVLKIRHPEAQLAAVAPLLCAGRSEEHQSELQSLMRSSYAVFCLKKKKDTNTTL